MYKGIGKARGAIALSGGHFGKGTGASGIVDEVEVAWSQCKRVCEILREAGITAHEFYDRTSKNRSTNIGTIVKWHNSKSRVLDVSFHLNAATASANGTEVLYVSEKVLAEKVTNAICAAGDFRNRGAKHRSELGFLNGTTKPAILLETFFVGNADDVKKYRDHTEAICFAVAKELALYVGVTIEKVKGVTSATTNKTEQGGTKQMDILKFDSITMTSEVQAALDSMVADELIDKSRAEAFRKGTLNMNDALGVLFAVYIRAKRKEAKK